MWRSPPPLWFPMLPRFLWRPPRVPPPPPLPALPFIPPPRPEGEICHSFIAALTEQHSTTVWLYSLTHLMWVHWPVPCNQVEVWGALQGWRGWGCSWSSWDLCLRQSYRSGRGSENTYWTYVLLWKEADVKSCFLNYTVTVIWFISKKQTTD